MNTTPHLNRVRVRQTAIELASTRLNGFGRPRFERVSQQFIERIEAIVRSSIREQIARHPSKGKTLM